MFLLLLPFSLALMRLINRDFYYDEMYSLVHYILVPIRQTVWEFKDLNNHFLANAVNNVLCMSHRNLSWILEHPWYIRLPQLAWVGLAVGYMYKLGKLYNERVALIAVTVLITTIPYYYYAVQVRGYAASVALATMLIYYVEKND